MSDLLRPRATNFMNDPDSSCSMRAHLRVDDPTDIAQLCHYCNCLPPRNQVNP